MGADHLLLVNTRREGGEELLLGGGDLLLLSLDCDHGGGVGEGDHLCFFSFLLPLSFLTPASHPFSSSSSSSASLSVVMPPITAWQGECVV